MLRGKLRILEHLRDKKAREAACLASGRHSVWLVPPEYEHTRRSNIWTTLPEARIYECVSFHASRQKRSSPSSSFTKVSEKDDLIKK